LFSQDIQNDVINRMGRESYLKLPKPGTNPRGVEISTEAIRELANHPESRRVLIQWEKTEILFDPYKRWLDMWSEEAK